MSDDLTLDAARLALHQNQLMGERINELLDLLMDLAQRWIGHSASCCVLDADGRVIVTRKSCRCDALSRRVYDAVGWEEWRERKRRPAYDGCAW